MLIAKPIHNKGPTWVTNNLLKSLETTMGHMKAIHQGTQSKKVTRSINIKSDDNNEDNDLLLEEPRSHIELIKNHQVVFGVIDLDKTENIKGLVYTYLP